MSRKGHILAAQVIGCLLIFGAAAASAQTSANSASAPAAASSQGPATSGQIQLKALPIAPQQPPAVNMQQSAAEPFERQGSVITLPAIFGHQWSMTKEFAPENLISESYLRSADETARALTLKEAIYIALRNNPSLQAAALDPVAAMETIRQANGTFDPNLTSQEDVIKNVTPATSSLQTNGGSTYVQKNYDWNFGLNKVSSITNGTWGVTFDNNRALTNAVFTGINPAYTPTLELSLSQPLLQNFGWDFATINVRIAESGQKQAQWNYGQALLDFVQKIGGEYWNVVLAEENLEVARAALRFNQDLVRQNAIALKVGTLAPIDLQEAQSAAATAEANVYTAEANLKNTRTVLRQDVMLNPRGTFIPEDIEPITRPNPKEQTVVNQDRALETAVQYRPSLEGMREAIRQALLQVKFAENQTLPQLTLGTQFGLTAVSGSTSCLHNFGGALTNGNCTPPGPFLPNSGTQLPFGGIYGDALNHLWSFGFYNYAAVLTFQFPLDNAAARAALSQAKVQYEQQRAQYRTDLSQAIVDVQSSIANLYADEKRAAATAQATYFARQSLHDEEVRFRVGMATTHDLLQFQEEEVSAEGNQVQAEVDLENARLAFGHSTGDLLRSFQIDFHVEEPHQTPWYAAF
jgi:outer membrane protein